MSDNSKNFLAGLVVFVTIPIWLLPVTGYIFMKYAIYEPCVELGHLVLTWSKDGGSGLRDPK